MYDLPSTPSSYITSPPVRTTISTYQMLVTYKLTLMLTAIAIGLIAMMWPILTRVQYECLPAMFSSRRLWIHITISLILNWIIGPLVMLAVAWATLPDLPTYRTGVIMVGLARCIAMVMIWNQMARGDHDYCAILVIINSVLQIILYSPYAVLFINIIGNTAESSAIHVSYGNVAISVLIVCCASSFHSPLLDDIDMTCITLQYLGIPLLAGILTRFIVWFLFSKNFLLASFLPYFGPLSLLGLLYTIIVMFAYQGHHILHNLGPVFRTIVPLLLYFLIMWTLAFWTMHRLSIRSGRSSEHFGYEITVVQAFTAGSNNFVSGPHMRNFVNKSSAS